MSILGKRCYGNDENFNLSDVFKMPFMWYNNKGVSRRQIAITIDRQRSKRVRQNVMWLGELL